MDFHLLALHMRQELMPALSSKSRQSRDLSGQLPEKVLTMLLELGLKHRQVAPSSILCNIYIKLSIHNFSPIHTLLSYYSPSYVPCPFLSSSSSSSSSFPHPLPFPFLSPSPSSSSSS